MLYTYKAEFKTIYSELLTADNIALTKAAANGGWRKRIIDRGKTVSASLFDISQLLSCVCGLVVKLLPPMGAQFRRSLVAQAILDQQNSVW